MLLLGCCHTHVNYVFLPPGFGAATGAVAGTTVKFNAPTGTDTMVKNNTQQHINTRFMCIVTMKEYESKSLEELRMEDYAANRKGNESLGCCRGSARMGLGEVLWCSCWVWIVPCNIIVIDPRLVCLMTHPDMLELVIMTCPDLLT